MALNSSFYPSKHTWHRTGNVQTTGFAWFGEKYLEKSSLSEFIYSTCPSFDAFTKITAMLSGDFSIWAKKDEAYWAMCSLSWTYPLFYKYDDNCMTFSDDPQQLTNDTNFIPEPFTKTYFLTFGVTPGRHTLHPGIFQVMPGEIICYSGNTQESHSIFRMLLSPKTTFPSATKEELSNRIRQTFNRFSTIIGHRRVLLPLTRGYDSRLLACLLKELGHTNVICATWGRKNNIEEETARRVAHQLGFDYCFVDYDKIVHENFPNNPKFQTYIHYSGHWSSMPYLQDYFAIQYLLENHLIDKSTVVLPGHMGDFLGGSHLSEKLLTMGKEDLSVHIQTKFSTFIPTCSTDKKAINNFIESNYIKPSDELLWRYFEYWDQQERQSKFIVNSTTAFQFSGLTVYMPFFDHELLHFFYQLPFSQRVGSKFYHACLEQDFFTPHHVDFDLKQKKQQALFPDKIRRKLLHLLPHAIKKSCINMKDPIFYREMTRWICQTDKQHIYTHPLKPNHYNAYIVQWYLNKLKP